MRLLHHADGRRAEHQPARQDPVAAAVWRDGLTMAPAASSPKIAAPHASELIEATAAKSHPDAA